MKHILLILATLFTTSAFAVGIGNDNPPSGGTQLQGQAQGQLQGQAQGNINVITNDVSSRISNDVRQNAYSYVNPTSNSGASANAGGAVSNSGLSITTPKNTPDLGLGNVYPTAPCMGSSQIGGSGVGFGFGIGTSWKDDDCGIRETSRSFNSLGLKDDAIKVLCTSQYAVAAPSCAQVKAE